MQIYFYCSPDELDTLAGAFSACTNELCVCVDDVQQTQDQLRQDYVYLDVDKTAAKEFGSACPSGRWFSNPANR